MRNVINIAARWLTAGFAILTGAGLVLVGLLGLQAGSLGGGAIGIVMAFVFFVPALFTLFGGSIKWMRWLWGGMAVLSLLARLAPKAQTGVAPTIVFLLFLAISFAGRDQKVEEEEDVSAFS